MPPGKRRQSTATFYALITFVGLFIAATTAAVIFYVRAEENRKEAAALQSQIDDLATREELQQMPTIVGTDVPRQSRLGTMVDYLNRCARLIMGGPLEQTSAEVKANTAGRDANAAFQMAQPYLTDTIDPNTTGLVTVLQKMKNALDNTIKEKTALQNNLAELQQRFDDAVTASQEKEKELIAEKEQYHQQALEITQQYEELKSLMEKTAEERAQNLMAQLDEERQNLKTLNERLNQTRAQLEMTQDRMENALEKLREIKPLPGKDVPAFKPDGKVVLVDDQAGVVHLNIGSDDRVYRGLTFSVYDRNAPIPENGKGKAELEVFGLAKQISAARIVRSEEKNPVAVDDNIANLVWDSDKTNVFAIAGRFDLDDDGKIDPMALKKIESLIRKWGGSVKPEVTVNTDFVVLGMAPVVPKEPTREDLMVDPTADEEYEAAMKELNRYNEIQDRAQSLRLPIFSYDRFLYFIGYKEQATQPGAF
jgi:hypothetical protein